MSEQDIIDTLAEIIEEFRAAWTIPTAEKVLAKLKKRGLKIVEVEDA